MLRASRELCAALGLRAVLLKGGHLARGRTRLADVEAAAAREALEMHRVVIDGMLLRDANMEILFQAAPATAVGDVPVVVDVLCEGGDRDERGTGKCTVFVRPFLDSGSTHGTGCTLSAALACGLARGEPLVEAVKLATMYTHECIAASFPVGSGHGPLNHMHSLLPRVLPRPTQSDPYPLVRMLICSNAGLWKQYVEHDFIKQLGKGTLSRERFIHFIKQGYLYLKYYARANGLLASKSLAYSDFAAGAEMILAIVKEREMHVSWGVDLSELENTPESPPCTAYGAYIIDIGLQGDTASLLMALAVCLLGYGEVGLWLQREAKRPQSWVQIENNPYRKWIENCSGVDYQSAVKAGIERVEALALDDPPSPKKLARWKEIWGRCMCFEKRFWDMAMDLS
ncbi:hypothetical protein F5148DRAFT_458710 [Russula earlei]|uniref:Uncharacterized protein n=1 Tax=Russula earlei TaxID=71964 RepID=A0ACC0U0A3_9AGAM|nr:hypothetical protein F5148DRAFT_458710 [Russula earlei]